MTITEWLELNNQLKLKWENGIFNSVLFMVSILTNLLFIIMIILIGIGKLDIDSTVCIVWQFKQI